jgi:hypothetical protein
MEAHHHDAHVKRFGDRKKGLGTKIVLILVLLYLFLVYQQLNMVPEMSSAACHPAASKHEFEARSKSVDPTTLQSPSLPSLQRLIKPPPRNKTAAICAVMKSEEPYIDEWVDFHLGIGFGPIYLYDNSDDHEMEQWARRRQQAYNDPVFVIHYPGPGKQKESYRNCAEHARDQHNTWSAFIDIDEFVVIKNRTQYPHIVDLLREYASSGSFHVWWRNFGTSGQEVYEPIPVTKRFQYRVQDDYRMNHQFKSIVHIPDFDFTRNVTTPHWFSVTPGAAVADTSRKYPLQWKNAGPDDVIALYHYQFKSFGELVKNKRARGDSWWGINKHFVRTAHKRQTQDELPLPNGTIFDDLAWQILKSVAPRYSVYDVFDIQNRSDFVHDTYNSSWTRPKK